MQIYKKSSKVKRLMLSVCFCRSVRSISRGNPPGKPGRPVVVRVEGTSVSLEWTAPDENGGLAITGYRINYSVTGSNMYSTVHLNQATTSHRFSGRLIPRTSYRFAVAAFNKAGEGLWSDFSDCIKTHLGN